MHGFWHEKESFRRRNKITGVSGRYMPLWFLPARCPRRPHISVRPVHSSEQYTGYGIGGYIDRGQFVIRAVPVSRRAGVFNTDDCILSGKNDNNNVKSLLMQWGHVRFGIFAVQRSPGINKPWRGRGIKLLRNFQHNVYAKNGSINDPVVPLHVYASTTAGVPVIREKQINPTDR